MDHMSSCQVPVLDPVWLICRRAESSSAIRFVVGIIPFKPNDATVTFKSKDVRCNPIQKPSVMADNHSTARKIL